MAAVFVAARAVKQEVLDRVNIEFGQLGAPFGADAAQAGYRPGEGRDF
jgi:hypothetical protein